MRLIEKQMIEAIEKRLNFRKDNTDVIQCEYLGFAEVRLHGHTLGTYLYSDDVFYPNPDTLREWPTNTTKSRLRALGVNVYTKKGVTYLNGQTL